MPAVNDSVPTGGGWVSEGPGASRLDLALDLCDAADSISANSFGRELHVDTNPTARS